jgi:hypothetical protein
LEVTFEANAHPFGGTFVDALAEDDLRRWRDALRDASPSSLIVLGGGRAAELRLKIAAQHGGEPGRWVVEVTLTRSGDLSGASRTRTGDLLGPI